MEALNHLPTPCYVLDEEKLRQNGEILAQLQRRTGCRVLLAQKAFSNYDLYPMLGKYLAGTEASGLFEARLGREEMPQGEVHVFCGAYREQEWEQLLAVADHIVFNSVNQLRRFGPRAKAAGKSVGLRINPECSTQEGHAIYDPCAPGSRLGVTRGQWDQHMTQDLIDLLDGLHFHTLCEQDADALEITFAAVEEKFGEILPKLKWLNMGGGHHITRPGYDIPRLERCIANAQRYGLTVYLEPGEAVALNAGYLVTTVLDITQNAEVTNVIIDASAACHMPDVLEMPYMPPLQGAGNGNYVYQIGGPTCLAGDVIGSYRFPHPIQEGSRLIFEDMAIYTTCKNNTFNGMPLPDLYVLESNGTARRLTNFGYADFKARLGSK